MPAPQPAFSISKIKAAKLYCSLIHLSGIGIFLRIINRSKLSQTSSDDVKKTLAAVRIYKTDAASFNFEGNII
jgi:hypothetical protein